MSKFPQNNAVFLRRREDEEHSYSNSVRRKQVKAWKFSIQKQKPETKSGLSISSQKKARVSGSQEGNRGTRLVRFYAMETRKGRKIQDSGREARNQIWVVKIFTKKGSRVLKAKTGKETRLFRFCALETSKGRKIQYTERGAKNTTWIIKIFTRGFGSQDRRRGKAIQILCNGNKQRQESSVNRKRRGKHNLDYQSLHSKRLNSLGNQERKRGRRLFRIC